MKLASEKKFVWEFFFSCDSPRKPRLLANSSRLSSPSLRRSESGSYRAAPGVRVGVYLLEELGGKLLRLFVVLAVASAQKLACGRVGAWMPD